MILVKLDHYSKSDIEMWREVMSQPTPEKTKFFVAVNKLFTDFSKDLNRIIKENNIEKHNLRYFLDFRQQITGIIKFLDNLYNTQYLNEIEFKRLSLVLYKLIEELDRFSIILHNYQI